LFFFLSAINLHFFFGVFLHFIIGANNYDAPDLQAVGNNAYRFVNAVSDFATHAKPLRRSANYKENLFARTVEGNPLIDRAYQLVSAA
ncbi:hypothetical protein AALB53_22345, partial [Lachnospiraceae bacterium 47-T17]